MDYSAFTYYLEKEKKASENTLVAYVRDVKAFDKYMKERGSSIEDATKTDVVTYMMDLSKTGRSRGTTNRKLASLRAAYNYLIKKGLVTDDPTEGIKTPRAERKDLDFLTLEEVELLLSLPDDSVKGKRDKAILEVLYGTGIRVMELIELNYGDINMKMGYIQCSGSHGRPRIIPIGSYARTAVSDYLRDSRPALLREEENKEDKDRPFFVNYQGERFTRQGLWKVCTAYGKMAHMDGRISPHILRTSFAVHMVQNGADIKTLQELLGYDDVQAMQIYLQVTKSRIKDVYDKTHPRA